MLEIHAAWADGAVESDVAAIEVAMGLTRGKERSAGLLPSIKRLFARSSRCDIRVKKADLQHPALDLAPGSGPVQPSE